MSTKRLHPLNVEGTALPERFTYPFCYEPHPLAVRAAEAVQRYLATIDVGEGKMFGVLVVKTAEGGVGFLAAYSGLLCGRNDWPYFVPPVFDAQQPDGHFKTIEREISRINQESTQVAHEAHVPLSKHGIQEANRGQEPLVPSANTQLSQQLQLWLFHQYQFLNARGEKKDLITVWQDYHCSPRIRRKYPLPPGGTGDCCAPKLLQYAYQQGLKPICMAEFWWGESPKSEVRHHGQFYPACRGKCKPVLTWMLQGLDIDPNPEEAGFPRLGIELVWEDDSMAVLNKPSGVLSIPGRSERYSVATWAQQRWPGAMLVHRLDMWTSGILLVAKTTDAYHHLQKQFEEHSIKKKYIAIVCGVPQQEHGVIDLPLLCDPLNRPRQVVDYKRGKRAITEYRVIDTPSPERTLLALYPHTGRTHQLRMHCAYTDGLNCPILGDELYGKKADRLYLHAQAISFIHPVTERRMHFSLPNPF